MKHVYKIIMILFISFLLVGCQSSKNDKSREEIKKELESSLKEIDGLKIELSNKEQIIQSMSLDIEKNKKELNNAKDKIENYMNDIKEKEKEVTKLHDIIANEDLIIFGIRNIFGSSQKRLNNLTWKIIKDNKITFSFKGYENHNNPELLELIKNDERFLDIKALTNRMYSVYSIDKKIGEFYGEYTWDELFDYIVFNEEKISELYPSRKQYKFYKDVVDDFYISGNYNHMPRKVDVLINLVKESDEKYDIVKYKDFDEEVILNIGRELIGVNKEAVKKEIVIAQFIETDLNDDSKLEKIVNFNNAFIDKEDISKNWFEKDDYEKYYSIIVVLDDKNNIIDFVQNIPSFIVNTKNDYLNVATLFSNVINVIDVNKDNEMEIIVNIPIWEGKIYRISYMKDNVISSKDYVY